MSTQTNKNSKVVGLMLHKYPNIEEYYDNHQGAVLIPVSKYNSDDKIRDEIYELLRTPDFLNVDKLCCWAMYIRPVLDADSGKMVDGVVVTTVQSDI